MKKLAVFLCACFSCFCFAATFSGLSLDAKAYDLPPGTTTITGEMLHQIIGDSPTCSYIGADNQWVSTKGSFYRIETLTGGGTTALSSNVWNGRKVCWYSFSIPYDYMTSTLISPIGMLDTNLHFSNVSYIDFGFVSFNSNKYLNLPVGTVRPYCYLDYYVSGSSSILYGASDTNAEHMGSISVMNQGPPSFHYFANFGKYEGSATDFYYTSISCPCLSPYSGTSVLIGVPEIIVNSDYVLEVNGAPPSGGGGDAPSGSSSGNASGTIKDNGDGTQDVNITIEQDNSGLIGGILDGIKNLFIPSDEQLKAFTDDMHAISDEHLGGLSEAVEIIDSTFDGIDDLSARESITVDTLRIPLLGSQEFLLGGWTIPLKPSTSGGFAALYTAIALLADFFAAFAFLKMCRNKLEIILNPDSEVIESGS